MSDSERLGASLADRYRIERELGAGGIVAFGPGHDAFVNGLAFARRAFAVEGGVPDVGEADLRALLLGKINTRDTSHAAFSLP